jgi:hypothetical protein
MRNLFAPLGRWKNWDRWAARAGAFLAARRRAGRAILFAGGFALVVLLVHREVYSFLAQSRRYTLPRVETAVAPAWADRTGEEVVRVDLGTGGSLFDAGLVERVARAFESSPWIRRVLAVERVFPDRLRVRFEYRRAHAAVRRANGHVLVDSDGVRLPGVWADPPTCDRPAVITGIASAPPTPGKVWDDPALRAGLAMADFVHGDPILRRLGVKEVDVANFGGRLDPRRTEVALVTAGGCVVHWGRDPSQPRFGDPSTDEKLENLREVLAVYPDLAGLRSVKVYFKGARAVEPQDTAAVRRTR